jgi:integrase
MENDRAMVVSGTLSEISPEVSKLPGTRNKSANVPAIRQRQAGDSDYVPHLSRGDIHLMAIAAKTDRRNGRRNAALIRTIFDGALRISEALGIRRVDLEDTGDGWLVHVNGKTGAGVAAISSGTVNELLAYWGDAGLGRDVPIFGITRSTAYRIIVAAYAKAGLRRPGIKTDRVGCVHILRHSGALERLKLTNNPRAVQHQLRHRSSAMTLRYLKTQQADESMVIQQGADPTW